MDLSPTKGAQKQGDILLTVAIRAIDSKSLALSLARPPEMVNFMQT